MSKIIIHFPFKIRRNQAAASQIRPLKIIEAFKSMGFDVNLVEGYGIDRTRQIKEIKTAVNLGEKFEFVYSECNTTPTLLTEKHHYPTYPFLDFSFFKFCKNKNIPIGLFYRDIYWCFPENNKGIVRKVIKLFHKYDLLEYNKYVSALFVPSHEMLSNIPFSFKMPIHELYPGCDEMVAQKTERNSKIINILYVGGIGHHYDVSMIMEVVKDLSSINLTICCRPNDWESVEDEYQSLLSENIKIVHKKGEELEQLYADADLFCLFVRPDKYREFAVPFKLFEAIGYGCPILASEATWVAKFVNKNKVGFTCKYDPSALRDLLVRISANPDMLNGVSNHVSVVVKDNTWESRCNKIVKTLKE